jgi:hypothetical protein
MTDILKSRLVRLSLPAQPTETTGIRIQQAGADSGPSDVEPLISFGYQATVSRYLPRHYRNTTMDEIGTAYLLMMPLAK